MGTALEWSALSVSATNTGIRILIPNTIRRIFESADFPEYSNTRIFPEYYSNTTCNVTCSCQGATIRVFHPFFWSITVILSSILSSISSIDSSIASILSSNLLVSSMLLSKWAILVYPYLQCPNQVYLSFHQHLHLLSLSNYVVLHHSLDFRNRIPHCLQLAFSVVRC